MIVSDVLFLNRFIHLFYISNLMRNETWELDETILLFRLKHFRTQKRAFDYMDCHNEKRLQNNLPLLHVFAREFANDGRRYFVVEEISSFFQKYINMRPKDRTFYESIRRNYPCRLYFDLEYDKTQMKVLMIV